MKDIKKKGLFPRWYELSEKERIVRAKFNILAFLITAGALMLLVCYPVSFEGSLECSSGDIDLDLKGTTYLVDRDIEPFKTIWKHYVPIYKDGHPHASDYFEAVPTYQLESLNINGIDGLNCKGYAKAKGPLYLALIP